MKKALQLLALTSALSAPLSQAGESQVEPSQRRGAEQTLLTFPEWFLVHSPAEYAEMERTAPAHKFPFFKHIGQIWSSYMTVTREQMRKEYPINAPYHVMIVVIASSTTVEYALRGLYENTIGRVSYLASLDTRTAEDDFSARAAQDYVDFIRREPWYLFDFKSRLCSLWTDVPWTGPGLVRKWERRYALTTEYTVKWGYSKLIEMSTRAAYTPALMTTQVILSAPFHGADSLVTLKSVSGVKNVVALEHNHYRVDLPRYYAFRIAATTLATKGFAFDDIAGNSGEVLVSYLTDSADRISVPGQRNLFDQEISTKKNTNRFVSLIPISNLSEFLLKA